MCKKAVLVQPLRSGCGDATLDSQESRNCYCSYSSHIHTHTHTHATHMQARTYRCTRTHIRTHAQVHTHTPLNKRTHTHAHAHISPDTDAHTHTCMHACIRTHRCRECLTAGLTAARADPAAPCWRAASCSPRCSQRTPHTCTWAAVDHSTCGVRARGQGRSERTWSGAE